MRTARDERGRAGLGVVIVLLVLLIVAGVLLGADTYASRRVEREVALQLQTELGTPGVPQVDVVGWPFLTQVVSREISTVHVVADDVGAATDAGTLPIEHVDMTLTDVTTDDWWQTMNAGRADGTARVGYDELRATSGVPLAYVGGGRFSVDRTTDLYGLSVRATVTGRLALDVGDQTLTLADPTVEVAGYSLPDVVATGLIAAVVKPIPLTGIPFGLEVTSVDPRDDALYVGLSGQNLPIER